jgi:hypothetical protein
MMPINKKLFPNQQDRFMRYLLQIWVSLIVICLMVNGVSDQFGKVLGCTSV